MHKNLKTTEGSATVADSHGDDGCEIFKTIIKIDIDIVVMITLKTSKQQRTVQQ